MFAIQWDHNLREANTISEVDRILDELHATFSDSDPHLATVESTKSGDSLAIGLGRERSVLNYVSGSKNPPYFTSIGDIELDEPLSFRFGGEWSEFPMRNSIPTSNARKAMRHFCETGALSLEVQWEED